MNIVYKLTRQELYDEVWSSTLLALSEKYDITDRGLAKLCDRYNIPRPRNGYWTKLKHGKKIKVPPLPKKPDGVSGIIKLERANNKIRQEQKIIQDSLEVDSRCAPSATIRPFSLIH